MDEEMTNEELDAYMARSMEELLSRLDAPEVVSDHAVSSPDLTFAPSKQAVMTDDPLNAASVGESVNHTVRTAPAQEARERNLVTPEVSWDLAIRPPEPAEFVPAREPVIHSVAGTDVGFQQFLSLTRNANTSAKRNGSLAASIAYTVGQDGASVTQGSPTAIAARVTAALLAAEQGASASAQPHDGSFDAVWAPLSDIGAAEDAYQDAHAVYMPSGLSAGAMAALASLMVPGGPGAYTWRYRGAQREVPPDEADLQEAAAWNAQHPDDPRQIPPRFEYRPDPRANFMPSVTRHMHAGGSRFILIVTERRDIVLPAVGGASLTVANLTALEAFYRRFWGNEVWDAAWRGTLAMAAIYRAPVLDEEQVITPGENFEVRRASHSVDGVNLHDPMFTWDGPQTPPAAGGDMAFPMDAIDHTRHGTSQEIRDIGWRTARQHNPALPRRCNSVEMDATGIMFNFRMPGQEDDQFLDRAWDDIFAQPLRDILGDRERRLLRSTYLRVCNMTMPMGLNIEPDALGERVDENTIYRNVFGARDHARMALPGLSMDDAVGLIANYTQPARRKAVHSVFSRNRRRERASNYAGRLHLAIHFSYVRHNVWPCDLKTYPRPHSGFIRGVPRALRPWCWMDGLLPDYYQDQNWVVLESSGLIRGAASDEPFAGTLVPGTWPKNSSGIVDLTNPRVNFCAVEAAFRNAVNDGGVIAADGRFRNTNFVIVRGNNGLVHALGFAPRIDTPRGTAGVSLHADNGVNTLQSGANTTGPIYSVY